jgi:hypothetical protein
MAKQLFARSQGVTFDNFSNLVGKVSPYGYAKTF